MELRTSVREPDRLNDMHRASPSAIRAIRLVVKKI
jgi:hypothetical protein